MISFRYHLVTIVAVFLALGLGVVAGTTVVDQGLVSRLQEQTSSANRSAELARERVGDLAAELSRTTSLTDQALPILAAGRLDGARIVIMTDNGTKTGAVNSVYASLSAAGADVTAVISLTKAAAVEDARSRESLAALLEVSPSSTARELTASMASQLASRLTAGVRGEQDRLVQLLEGGFLEAGQGSDLDQVNGQLPGVGGPAQSVIVVSGGVGTPPVDPASFLEPLTGVLVPGGTDVAAAEPGHTDYEFVTELRDSGVVDSGALVTVDDVDEPVGEFALVDALGALREGAQGGNYGFKAGATDGLFPSLSR